MSRIARSPAWPLVAVLLALFLAYDLGAAAQSNPAPASASNGGDGSAATTVTPLTVEQERQIFQLSDAFLEALKTMGQIQTDLIGFAEVHAADAEYPTLIDASASIGSAVQVLQTLWVESAAIIMAQCDVDQAMLRSLFAERLGEDGKGRLSRREQELTLALAATHLPAAALVIDRARTLVRECNDKREAVAALVNGQT